MKLVLQPGPSTTGWAGLQADAAPDADARCWHTGTPADRPCPIRLAALWLCCVQLHVPYAHKGDVQPQCAHTDMLQPGFLLQGRSMVYTEQGHVHPEQAGIMYEPAQINSKHCPPPPRMLLHPKELTSQGPFLWLQGRFGQWEALIEHERAGGREKSGYFPTSSLESAGKLLHLL